MRNLETNIVVITLCNLTWVFPGYSADFVVLLRYASLLNRSDSSYSGPVFSDWRIQSWELNPDIHSFSLTNCRNSDWRRKIKKENDFASFVLSLARRPPSQRPTVKIAFHYLLARNHLICSVKWQDISRYGTRYFKSEHYLFLIISHIFCA